MDQVRFRGPGACNDGFKTHLIGKPWQEAELLNHAYVLEQAAGFVSKPEKWW